MRACNLIPRTRQANSALFPFSHHSWLDQLFDASFPWKISQSPESRDNQPAVSSFIPRIDVHDTEKEYVLRAEIPGVSKEDVHIEVHDAMLTLSGEKKTERKEGDGTHSYVCERSFGSFERSMSLPEDADREKIQASHKDGILTIRIPKKQGETARKSIDITNA